MAAPVISFIVPCFNQGRYLQALVENVAKASTAEHELVIVDDGSTDRLTLRTLDELRPVVSRQRIVAMRQVNGGPAKARNLGIACSSGSYLVFLDGDDLLLSHSMDSQLETLSGVNGHRLMKNAEIAVGRFLLLDDATNRAILPQEQISSFPRISFDSMACGYERELAVPIHCAMFSRDLFDRGLRWEESLICKEDWLFWLDALEKAGTPVLNPRVVAVYRRGPTSITWSSTWRNALGWLQATELARLRHGARFGEEAHALAAEHFSKHYLPRLWAEFGEVLPWSVARSFLDPAPSASEAHSV